MNIKALKQAEREFLKRYRGGFEHPDMVEIGKKFKMEQHLAFAKSAFGKPAFDDPELLTENMARLVSRSGMVSMFEKPKFKAAVMQAKSRDAWAESLYTLLHGPEKTGFVGWVDQLAQFRLAKWTLASVFQFYYRPKREEFLKPSTVKMVVEKLELDLSYHSRPTWEFYRDYRKALREARKITTSINSKSNAAYSGFLMMSFGTPRR